MRARSSGCQRIVNGYELKHDSIGTRGIDIYQLIEPEGVAGYGGLSRLRIRGRVKLGGKVGEEDLEQPKITISRNSNVYALDANFRMADLLCN